MRFTVLGSLGVYFVIVACGPTTSQKGPNILKSTANKKEVTSEKTFQKLNKETVLKTPKGATFTVAKNWCFRKEKGFVILQEPDREVSIYIGELAGTNAEKVIETAWKHFQPGFSRKIKMKLEPPPQDGFDEIASIFYETKTMENRVVFAVGQRKGSDWYLILVDGDKKAYDRRAAQASIIINSLKAEGLKEESFKGKVPHKWDQTKADAFAAFIEEYREKTKVPGVAVEIVSDNRVVFEKAFGVQSLSTKKPVTPKTLFMIGSITKSLTTLMMAMLVDNKKFQWETQAVSLFPLFQLGDPNITKQVTMEKTVCACTGLPRQDMEFLFEYKGITPKVCMERMKNMKPTTGFGETFQYSNMMVAVGGFIAAHTLFPQKSLGSAYDKVMQDIVFKKLGMESTTFDFAKVKSKEHALPSGATLQGDYVSIPLSYEDFVIALRPAGGAWSNVRDMSRWILTELSKGKNYRERHVVSEENLVRRWKPQVKISDKMSYGLGLVTEDYHDVRVIHHNGGTMGFSSSIFFLPELNLGGVILTNAQGAHSFINSIMRKLFEIIFDGKELANKQLAFALKTKKEVLEKENKKINFSPEKTWLSKLVGNYQNADLGKITIRIEDNIGVLDAGEWKSKIAKKTEYDGTIRLILTDPPLAGLPFILFEKDGKQWITLEFGQHKYIFEPL